MNKRFLEFKKVNNVENSLIDIDQIAALQDHATTKGRFTHVFLQGNEKAIMVNMELEVLRDILIKLNALKIVTP